MSEAAILREIFETLGEAPGRALEGQFLRWCAAPRFRTFAGAYRDKIRRKLRLVRDEQGLRDLALELEVAAQLLQDRRFGVEYEKGATSGRRYPDLAVTFRVGTLLHLEVKRVRTAGADPDAKCAEVVCDAVGQLVTGALNVVVIGLPSGLAPLPDVARALRALHVRAENNDQAYFQRRGFTDVRGFLRSLGRLSEVVMITEASGAHLYSNPAARRAMPADVRRALKIALAR